MDRLEPKIFWDVEKEKSWHISLLFIFLIFLYLFSFYVIWFFLRLFIFIVRPTSFSFGFIFFGTDFIIVLVIASIVACVHWYFSNKNVVNKILLLLGAKAPDQHDRYHCVFQNVVDEIESAAGGVQVERYVLPTGAMNAFALADVGGRKVIGITEGLLSRLNREELQAVTAHEMAHIVSNDCMLTTIACSLFGVFSEMLEQFNKDVDRAGQKDTIFLGQEMKKEALGVTLLYAPIIFIIFLMDVLSQLLNMFISREKEYRADASSVRYTRDPVSLASALYKIATHWRGTSEHLAPVFILNPQSNPLEEREDIFASMFSTHPPLTRRLQLILDMGHASISQITEQLHREKGVATEGEETAPQAVFFIEQNNAWLGPYTLVQLQVIDWLMPDSRLRLAGSDNIVMADSVPALNHFFKIRDEPLWKVRHMCPVCHEWLVVQDYEGLAIWRCAYCDGFMVEKEKLPRIFVRRDKGFTSNAQRAAQILLAETKRKKPHLAILIEASHARPCPKCGKKMRRKLYSYAYHVEVDECMNCGLVWFDKNEMEILQCMIELEGD